VAATPASFERLIHAVQLSATSERVSRVAIRCQTEFDEAYLHLIQMGYRVHWTDLRMLLNSHPQRVPDKGVLISNWEI